MKTPYRYPWPRYTVPFRNPPELTRVTLDTVTVSELLDDCHMYKHHWNTHVNQRLVGLPAPDVRKWIEMAATYYYLHTLNARKPYGDDEDFTSLCVMRGFFYAVAAFGYIDTYYHIVDARFRYWYAGDDRLHPDRLNFTDKPLTVQNEAPTDAFIPGSLAWFIHGNR